MTEVNPADIMRLYFILAGLTMTVVIIALIINRGQK